jgi:hypothetical protein
VFLDLVNPIATFEDPVPVIREFASRSPAGHIKDFALESIWTDDRYHRHGYTVAWKYPGEGVADLEAMSAALISRLNGKDFMFSIEGLDSRAGRADQVERLASSLDVVRQLFRGHV